MTPNTTSNISNAIAIHPIAPSQVSELAILAKTTFLQTFLGTTSEERVYDYVDQAFQESTLREELESPSNRFWFFQEGNQHIGYAKLRLEKPPYECIPGASPIELQRFYFDAAFHGKGHSRQLMEFCLEQARLLNADVMWLGVWENNLRAQKFYEKFGFYEVGDHAFLMGDESQRDLLMAKKLQTL